MPPEFSPLKATCQMCEVRDTAICSVLDDNELCRLNTASSNVAAAPGETVFIEGEDARHLFNVISGAIRLSKTLPDGRRQVTGFLFPGDFLGLSTAGIYTYTAEAIGETLLCRMDRQHLVATLEELPKLEKKLLQISQNELAQALDHLLILGRKTAMERVATVLLKFAERIGKRDGDGCYLELPMDRSDLADYLGLTVETVSRTLTALRKKGIVITPSTRAVCIPESDNLASHSGDF
jgi:CRP/FNR family transcriptional regulator